jgi:hypothetical protein
MNVYEQIAEEVEKGDYNPLEAYAQLKREEAILKSCIARVIEAAVEEAEKYPEKKFEAYGYAFERREGRKMYDFKHIPAWIAAKGEIKAIEDRAKAALAASDKGSAYRDHRRRGGAPAEGDLHQVLTFSQMKPIER